MNMRYLVMVLLLLTVSFQGNAQGTLQPDELLPTFPRPLPPTMIPVDSSLEPMELTKLDVNVRIHNAIAETKMIMTFYNPNDRNLAGDLYFPLPEGSLVSGYALDINGIMVDGSIITKDKARQVFEKEVRKGIDPGLIEYTKGNNYKTRVFPITAKGSRTIMVRYISSLDCGENGTHYLLPLNFKDPLKQFDIRVEVVKSETEPVIKEGLANFSFSRWSDSYVAQASLTDVSLTEDLFIAVPSVDKQPVSVELAKDGQYYFYINDVPKKQIDLSQRIVPKKVSIIWDASGSRKDANHERAFQILSEYFSSLFAADEELSQIQVSLSILRNTLSDEQLFTIENDNIDSLITELRAIRYDGGTQIGSLSNNKNTPDLYLLFSDGLSNFGKEKPKNLDAPIYILSGESITNHPYLHHLAAKNGGRYFNLAKLEDKDVISGIGASPYSFLSITTNNGEVIDTYPSTTQALGERFVLVGKLASEEASVTLHYGTAGNQQAEVNYSIKQEDASDGSLLQTYWAQQKINELLIFDSKNEEALVSLGKEFGLVTPGTSFLVLETLEQYVEHQVMPPESLPEMRTAYNDNIKEQQKQVEKSNSDKIEQIVSLWDERIAWWETDYSKQHRQIESQQRSSEEALEDANSVPAARAAPESPAAPPSAPMDSPTIVDGFIEGDEDYAVSADEEMVMEEAEEIAEEMTRGMDESPSDDFGNREKKEDVQDESFGEISIKAWDPNTPYLSKLKAAKRKERINVYFEQREEYSTSPAFYLDCAEFFFREKNKAIALQILSNVTELELENPALLRVAAHRLKQAGKLKLSRLLFEEVLKLRPEEPQSYRDLALVLEQLEQYKPAIDLLYKVVLKDWDRFDEIELIALMELNHIIPKAKEAGINKLKVDKRLIKSLDLDVRIVMTWDADLTDMDLWVNEPSGEKAYYGYNRTQIGGLVSRDFTQGYGPEEYLLKKALDGTYTIEANYFGSQSPELTGPVTLQLDIYSNYGREDEKHEAITIRLENTQEIIDVGEISF